MSYQELKDLVANLAVAHREIAAEQKETARQWKNLISEWKFPEKRWINKSNKPKSN